MSDHALNLLARAEKGGQAVHPGLRVDQGDWDLHADCTSDTYTCSSRCRCGCHYPFCPNPDPWALIAAAQKQGWVPHFTILGGVLMACGGYR